MTRKRDALAVRHQLFLPPDLSEKLARMARSPGVTKSQVLGAAVQSYFDLQGFDELGIRLGTRLDRISTQLGRIERNSHVELESLALFIRYMLAAVAPLAENDEAGRLIARDRFAAFVAQVGQQLASGKRALTPGAER